MILQTTYRSIQTCNDLLISHRDGDTLVGNTIARRNKWSLYGTLCLRCDPRNMAPLAIGPVECGGVRGDAVVPNHYRFWGPFDSHLKVLAECDVVIEELQEIVTFLLLVSDNVAGELWVHIECLFAGRRVCSNNWMDRCHWFASHHSTSDFAVLSLLDSCNAISTGLHGLILKLPECKALSP